VEEIEPRNVEVQLRIAEIYDLDNLTELAIQRYKKAIELAPGFFKPYQEMGRFLYFRGDYRNATERFREALARAPGLYEPYLYIGAAETDMGNLDEAERAFRSALQIKETGRSLCSLGAVKSYQRHYQEAAELMKRSLVLEPNSYICLMNLGDIVRWMDRATEAEPPYRKGLALAAAELKQNPRNGYTRAFVAYLAGRLGDRRRAEDEIEEALQLLPDDNKVIRRAVLIYEMLGQRQKALNVAARLTSTALWELRRHPDLADFSNDPRFQHLVEQTRHGGGMANAGSTS
jgi:tetratricopeptide (TPR) repeat protein